MSTKDSEKPKVTLAGGVAGAVVIVVIFVGLFVFLFNIIMKQEDETNKLKEAQLHAGNGKGFTFKNEAEFKEAVISTLNEIAQERSKESLKSKLGDFELAADIVPDGRKIYGSLDARFSLVEFSETECPYCIRHHKTMKDLVDASKGNVNWEWKHLPLGSHNPAAMTQAVIGECIAEQKGNRYFWAYIDEVFEQSRGGGQGVQDLLGLVESYDVDLGEIRKCAGSSDARDLVNEDVELAGNLGISGTPATYVVDNQTGNSQMVTGAQPSGVFTSTIKRLMDQAEAQNEPQELEE